MRRDTKIGRWNSKEPLGFEGSLNYYNYCHNDPVNYSDQTGLDEKPKETWADKIFGPRATKDDSWLWQTFRGTGDINQDLKSFSMGVPAISFGLVAGAGALAYESSVVGGVSGLIQACDLAGAKLWATGGIATAELLTMWNAIRLQTAATSLELYLRYLSNNPIIDEIFFQFLKEYRFKSPGIANTWAGGIAYGIGVGMHFAFPAY